MQIVSSKSIVAMLNSSEYGEMHYCTVLYLSVYLRSSLNPGDIAFNVKIILHYFIRNAITRNVVHILNINSNILKNMSVNFYRLKPLNMLWPNTRLHSQGLFIEAIYYFYNNFQTSTKASTEPTHQTKIFPS